MQNVALKCEYKCKRFFIKELAQLELDKPFQMFQNTKRNKEKQRLTMSAQINLM